MRFIEAIRKELERRGAEAILYGGQGKSRNSIGMENRPLMKELTFSSILELLLNYS